MFNSVFSQICEFNLAQEATPIIDKQLLEDVSRATCSSTLKVTQGIGKDIIIVKRETSPHRVGSSASRRIEALHGSATHTQHLVDGPNSLEVVARGLPTPAANVANLRASKRRPHVLLLPPPLLSASNLALKAS